MSEVPTFTNGGVIEGTEPTGYWAHGFFVLFAAGAWIALSFAFAVIAVEPVCDAFEEFLLDPNAVNTLSSLTPIPIL